MTIKKDIPTKATKATISVNPKTKTIVVELKVAKRIVIGSSHSNEALSFEEIFNVLEEMSFENQIDCPVPKTHSYGNFEIKEGWSLVIIKK